MSDEGRRKGRGGEERASPPRAAKWFLTAVYSSVVMNGERHCSQDQEDNG